MVWDIGTYEIIDGNYWQGKLHLSLNGKKLKGEWVLVKAKERDDNTWFLIKVGAPMKKPSARKENASAQTARTMEEIAQAADAVWHSNRNAG